MTGKVVVFNGETYVRNPNSKYYFKHTTRNEERRHATQLHRAVWEFYNGPIPDGYHIHHIDHDIDNNDISNLECISASEHLSMHGKENFKDAEYREKMLKNLEAIRSKAAEWHSSEEGLEWHRKHTEESLAKTWVKEERTCEECGKKFIGTKRGRFCSQKCYRHYIKRESGMPVRDRNRTCRFCGKEFFASERGFQKYCSVECRIAAQEERRKARQALKPKKPRPSMKMSEESRKKMRHAKRSTMKPVYCKETDTVYESACEAARELHIDRANLSKACKSKTHYACGYHVTYAECPSK